MSDQEDKEDQDIWHLMEQQYCSLSQTRDTMPTIISYPKAIPDIRLDPITYGQSQPDILFADQKTSNELILPSQTLMSKSLLKSRCVLDELIEIVDEQGPLQAISYDPFVGRMLKRSEITQCDFTQLASLLEATLYDDLLPGVETTLFTNNNLFKCEVESVGSAYLSREFKSYSLTNAVDKTTLTRERQNPLTQKLSVGTQLIDLCQLFEESVSIGNKYRSSMDESWKFRIESDENSIHSKLVQYNQMSANTKNEDFDICWSKIVEEVNRFAIFEEPEPEQSKQLDFTMNMQGIENAIISGDDVQFLSGMAEVQREAEKSARKQDIDMPENKEEEEEEEEYEEDDNDYEQQQFMEQVFFGSPQEYEIQEQDPFIRKQIEEALSIKSRFKIIKSGQVSQNQKRLDLSTYRWAIEDESDVSGFYDVLPKAKMAWQFKFELDPFQKRSVVHLERKESVLVCAHTSAGKTVVAEYAIALALKHNRRALYTSPIKALSNQKYREFEQKFGEGLVGVVTGDVSINPSASCLILTTEILRNMLYRGAEMVRDIEWVIFDEVHYVNDQERGMVWEETIIMLPPHVGIIMLSATVPNHMDFANWVGRTKKRPIYVMKTFTRPVPLEHHLYLFDKFHMIREKEGSFLSREYNSLKKQIEFASVEKRNEKERLKMAMQEKKDDELYKNTNRSQQQKFSQKAMKSRFILQVSKEGMRFKEEKRSIVQLIRLCEKKELLPAVIFVFSKKKISELAEAFMSQRGFKLIDSRTENIIINFFDRAVHRLKPQDRKSPQLIKLRELVRYGVAMHHGGLLPIAKEIVEMLFSEGLIKVLLATETFAMGINMPTKTVIFHSIDKYDNNGLRMLHSSEYTQMSGRAGRRGLDEKGTVIIFVRDPSKLPAPMQLGKMVDHKGQELQSKFRITYRIILNLMTSKDLDAAEMMKRSFHENYRFTQLPKHIQALERLRKDYVQASLIACPYQKGIRGGLVRAPIEEYIETQMHFRTAEIEFIYGVIDRSKQPVGFPRYVLFIDHMGVVVLGVAINVMLMNANNQLQRQYVFQPSERPYYKFSVLTIHSSQEDRSDNKILKQQQYKKLTLTYQSTLKFVPKQIRTRQGMTDYYYTISEVTEEDMLDFLTEQPTTVNKGSYMNTLDATYDEFAVQLLEKQTLYPGMSDMLDYLYGQQQRPPTKGKQGPPLSRLKYRFNKATQRQLNDSEDNDDEMRNYFKQRDESIKGILKHMCQNCDLKENHIKQIGHRNKTKTDLEKIKAQISSGDIEASSDFQNKLAVLKRLGYMDLAGLPLIKARIAREIQDASSLYICELLVENIMDSLPPSQIACLLSVFVAQTGGRGRRDNESDGEMQLLHQLQEIEDELPFDLSNALRATMDLVKKIVIEENTLDALETPDVGLQMRSVLDFGMCLAIYGWAKGSQFVDICYETDIEEGLIVMTILRLESLVRSIKNSYRVIGNLDMVEKMDKASFQIKKDIVFAESLYFDSSAKVKIKKD